MRTTRAVVLGATVVACGFVMNVAQAQQGITRIDLQRHDLSAPGREVVQTIVELDPGVRSSRHTHPGEEIVYVLEGAPLEYEVEGKPTATLKPGDVLFIPAGTPHAARNVGNRKGAELATYIVEKGKPLLTNVR
ncbi:MAG TPA: cupin domain-containing protein [Vicinamibacterales bacterium]|nr:cupin domain-containing protein [Vicinamibacterales bacterium]